jgi:hypothetical protein
MPDMTEWSGVFLYNYVVSSGEVGGVTELPGMAKASGANNWLVPALALATLASVVAAVMARRIATRRAGRS